MTEWTNKFITKWFTNTRPGKRLRLIMFVIITLVLVIQGLFNTALVEKYCQNDSRFWAHIIVWFISGVLCMSYMPWSNSHNPMWNDAFWLAVPIVLSIAYQIFLITTHETDPEKDENGLSCKNETTNIMQNINISILCVSATMAVVWGGMKWHKGFEVT